MHSARGHGTGSAQRIDEVCFWHELQKKGLHPKRHIALPTFYDGIRFDEGLRLDVLFDDPGNM
ncbi:MAG TPA: GxxExxY protein [Bacteroidota bacterium]|nr:GxxExxY protein [Bacteroidota bacterium]